MQRVNNVVVRKNTEEVSVIRSTNYFLETKRCFFKEQDGIIKNIIYIRKTYWKFKGSTENELKIGEDYLDYGNKTKRRIWDLNDVVSEVK